MRRISAYVLAAEISYVTSLLWVTSANAAGSADGSVGTELEEVVVTATKREENIEKVPVSIVAFSQSAMEVAGSKDIDSLASLTPGVQFDRQSWGGGYSSISFRGIVADAGDSPTGVYIDDTAVQGRKFSNGLSYFGNPYPVTFDLNRVEFDRGPQGTLFGAGAEGGAVRFIFNQPDLHEFSGEARGEAAYTQSGDPSYEAGLAGGGPIIAGILGFRASAYYRNDGGYVNRIDPFTGATVDANANYTETKAFRLALTGALTDSVSLTPSIYYQSTDTHDQGVYATYVSDPGDGRFNSPQLLRQPIDDSFYLPALSLDANLGWARLTTIASYFSRDASTVVDVTHIFGGLLGGYGNPLGTVYPVSYADAAPQPDSTAQQILTYETRLASSDPSASLTWVGGVFYSRRQQHETSNSYSSALAPGLGAAPEDSILFVGNKSIDTQVAAFGQADYTILDGLKVTGGLRVAEMKTTFVTASGGVLNAGSPPLARGDLKQTPVTPKLGISYQADEKSLYYVSVAKGYRTGGINSPLPTYCGTFAEPASYDSDYVWSYEIGAKNHLLSDRVQINSSVFHLNWRNIQNQILLPCGAAYLANTGNANSNGFDVALEALLTEALRLDFSASYTDAKLSNTVSPGGVPLVEKGDAIGTVPDVVAPWNLTLSARYDVALPGNFAGYIWLEDVYHSANPGPFSNDIPTSPNYFPEWVADPPTNMLNGRIGTTTGKLDVSLFVKNMLNSHPNLDKWVDVRSSTIYNYITFRPRTVGLDFDYHF
jgi:outer membrane receptor protein involved in Fe transport